MLPRYALPILAIIILLAAGIDCNTHSSCFAQEVDAINIIKADLDGCGSNEDISLITKPYEDADDDYFKKGELCIVSKGRVSNLDVGILESRSYSIELIKIADNARLFVAMFNQGGAHGLWLKLYSFNGKNINEEAEVFSDVGSIDFRDVDNDGIKEIIAVCRDYDNDPITDDIVNIYKFSNGKWKSI